MRHVTHHWQRKNTYYFNVPYYHYVYLFIIVLILTVFICKAHFINILKQTEYYKKIVTTSTIPFLKSNGLQMMLVSMSVMLISVSHELRGSVYCAVQLAELFQLYYVTAPKLLHGRHICSNRKFKIPYSPITNA
jgi:hypothetical protein